MKNLITKLVKDEQGQGMVEYGLIIAVVAIAIIGVLTTMGGGLSNLFQSVTSHLPATPPAG